MAPFIDSHHAIPAHPITPRTRVPLLILFHLFSPPLPISISLSLSPIKLFTRLPTIHLIRRPLLLPFLPLRTHPRLFLLPYPPVPIPLTLFTAITVDPPPAAHFPPAFYPGRQGAILGL